MPTAHPTIPSPLDVLPDVLGWFPRSPEDGVVMQLVLSPVSKRWRVDLRRWAFESGRWVPTSSGVKMRLSEIDGLRVALRAAAPRLTALEAKRAGRDDE